MSKTQQGGLLMVLGVLGAIGTLIARSRALDDHRFQQDVDLYTEAYGGTGTAGTFDNTPYLIAGAICALLVICGAILYASQSRRVTTA